MPQIVARAPFRGVNKALDPSIIGPTEAQSCLNVLLSYGSLRKRPGTTTRMDLSDYGPVLGMYDYLKLDTGDGSVDVIHLLKAGSTLFHAEDWIATAFPLAMSPTEPLDAITINNRCYFCDAAIFKVTDGATTYNPGIEQPATPTVAASATAGNLDGTYDYKITFYSSTWGQESPACAASATVAPVDKQVDITSIPTTSDVRVDKVRIYRRKVSAYETTWHYVKEIAEGTTSTTDNALDQDVSQLTIAPLSFDGTIPTPRYLAYQADVTFLAGFDLYPTRLYYTPPGQPWAAYQYIEVGLGHDTEPITGLCAFQGILVVFKERSIWVLSGNSADTFYLRKVHPKIGCRSHHSIVLIGSVIYFLSEDGFYAFDGANATPLSGAEALDPIRPDIVVRNYARDRYCVGIHDPHNAIILWTYSSGSSAVNDTVYAFHYEASRFLEFPVYSPWRFADGVSFVGRLSDPTTRDRLLHVGLNSGALLYLSGSSDGGQPIEWNWRSGDMDAGVGARFKTWRDLQIEFEQQSNASAVTARAYLSGAASPVTLTSGDQTRAILRTRVGHSSRYMSLELSGTSDEPSECYGWDIDYEVAGRG